VLEVLRSLFSKFMFATDHLHSETAIYMEQSATLKLRLIDAYKDQWLKHYNNFITLFSDPEHTILKAKTYAVVSECINFRSSTGLSQMSIYQILIRQAEESPWMRFSADLNLSSFENYIKSAHIISVRLNEYIKPKRKPI